MEHLPFLQAKHRSLLSESPLEAADVIMSFLAEWVAEQVGLHLF
jgi:hypothetical protein